MERNIEKGDFTLKDSLSNREGQSTNENLSILKGEIVMSPKNQQTSVKKTFIERSKNKYYPADPTDRKRKPHMRSPETTMSQKTRKTLAPMKQASDSISCHTFSGTML